jgi:hypothetical protein
MPFEQLKELFDKFGVAFSDEQCGFICSNFLRKITNGTVSIDFAAFLGALKSDKDKSVLRDNSALDEEKKAGMSFQDESDLEKTLDQDKRKRLLRPRKSLDEE